MTVAHSLKMPVIAMFLCVLGAVSMHMQTSKLEDSVNWEDFDDAISAEDCFGSHCGRASGALSLMQQSAKAIKAKLIESKEMTFMPDHEKENLLEALQSEDDDADMAALSLVQTGASVERTAISPSHASVVGAVQADGTIEMNPAKAAVPTNGMMQFSVDANGLAHGEDALSLMQTETLLEKKSTSSAHATETGAVQADGSIEITPHKMAVPSDGVMHFSVDGQGNFQAEEGLSLMQTDAHILPGGDDPSLTPEAPSAVVEGLSSVEIDAEGLSLVQTDARVERNPSKSSKETDGEQYFSVDSRGHFIKSK